MLSFQVHRDTSFEPKKIELIFIKRALINQRFPLTKELYAGSAF